MFSDEFNPVQHMVTGGKCLFCKQSFPGQGNVYTKQGMPLTTPPTKFTICKGEK